MTDKKSNEVSCEQPVPGLYMLKVVSAPLPPIYTTNCFVIGTNGGDAAIVDPSPIDDEEYRKLDNTLRRLKQENHFNYSGIFITHHHSDHLMNSPRLAAEYSVPISMSRDSYQRIVDYAGAAAFNGVPVTHAEEGDRLVDWQGEPVKVYAVPGHDEGQLALAPDNMAWFLAGDLIQGAGTVVILTDEGDMTKYFQSLERIIDLNPEYVFPSHGNAQKSTDGVKKTLKHRHQREKQVLKLYKKGMSPEQMLEVLYKGVNRRLWGLALQNIHSHLRKLEQDNALEP